MSGGDDTPADRKVISLKLLVDKARNRVIFAESDHEFVDTLLSFLTLPIGSAVRLLGPDSAAIGSLTTMYNSVASLESCHLRTDYCKDMLLNPRNATETQCSELKINVDPLEPVKLYRGTFCTASCRWWFSTIKDRPCPCKYPMSNWVNVDQAEKGAEDDCEGGGVFVNNGAFRFMITDDLQVMAGSAAACLSLFRKLGIDDGNEVEERTLEFGEQEVLRLLKFVLLSKSPLTEAILYIQCSSEKERIKFQPKRTPQPEKNARAANTNNMTLKLFASKSKKKILYAEAGVDVVDFLFSILTYPLGSIIKLLGKNSDFGCMDNLYKTVEDLGTGGYLKSEERRKMLLCPKLAPFHSVGNQLLQIEEASYPPYVYDCIRKLWVVAESEKCRLPSPLIAVVMDPKSPTGEVDAGKGYMKGPGTFMILNDLSVAPFSPVTSVALLYQMNIPFDDVVERVVAIGPDEALNLLNASLISKTVLSDVFNQREPYPEVIMHPPRGVRGRGGGLGRGLPEAHPHEEEEVVHEGEFEATKVMRLPPRVRARGGRGQGRGRGQAEVEDAIVEDIPEDEEVIGRWPRVRGGGRGWGSGLPKAQPQEEVFGPPPRGRGGYRGRGRGGYRGRGRGGYRGRGSGLPEAQPLEEEEEEVVHEDESETWIDAHPRVGFGEAPVRGRAREEEVLAVLEVVDSVVGDTGLGAMELRAALQEVQAILRPKAVVYSKRGVGASGRG